MVLPAAVLKVGLPVFLYVVGLSLRDQGELHSTSPAPERFSPSCMAAFPQKCRDLATSCRELHRQNS